MNSKANLANFYDANSVKGEVTLVIGQAEKFSTAEFDIDMLLKEHSLFRRAMLSQPLAQSRALLAMFIQKALQFIDKKERSKSPQRYGISQNR